MAKRFSSVQKIAYRLWETSCTTLIVYRFFPEGTLAGGGGTDRHILSTAKIKGVELNLHSPLHVFKALVCTNLHSFFTLFYETEGKTE